MIIKNMARLGLISASFALVVTMPVMADTAPATGGDAGTGAASASASVSTPSSGGTDTNGAVSNGSASAAPATGGGDSTGAQSGTGSSPVTNPATGGDSTTGAVSNGGSQTAPSTGGDSTNGSTGGSSTPATGGDNTNGASTGGSNNGSNGGSNGGSSGGSGGGYAGGGSPVTTGAGVPQILGASTSSCPFLTTYLKFGGQNDASEVAKLQIFLKSQGFQVTVNGTFDQATETAVEGFQKKYLADVLGPWDATKATGFVYITTTKKINELVCQSPLTLSASDLAIIAAYKQNHNVDGSVINPAGPTIDNSASTTVVNPDAMTDGSNAASVGSLNIFQRFWSFIVGLFR